MNGTVDVNVYEIVGKAKIAEFRKELLVLFNYMLHDPRTFRKTIEWKETTFRGDACYVADLKKLVGIKIVYSKEKDETMKSYFINKLQPFFTDFSPKQFRGDDCNNGFRQLDAVVREVAEVLNAVSGYYNDDPLHQKLNGTVNQTTKFRFFTDIIEDEFWLCALIKKDDFESDESYVDLDFWEKILSEIRIQCSICGELFGIKRIYHDEIGGDFYCRRCYCKHKCDFYKECYIDNEERMEMLLDELIPELEEGGFRFDGYEFQQKREMNDCYASFYLTNKDAKYKCEISTLFFVKDGEETG